MSEDFELEVNSLHASLEAVDHLRTVFESCKRNEGLTKKALAERIGRDPAYVSRVLNGRVSSLNYQTLARFLLAMDRWPELDSVKISELDHGNNYCHRLDVLENEPSGSTNDIWRMNLEAHNSEDSQTANLSSWKAACVG